MSEDSGITESVVVDGQMINATIHTKGWCNIIRPALDARLEALAEEFCNATTYEEFVRIQQSINAIKGLLSFIEVKLIEGKAALEELRTD